MWRYVPFTFLGFVLALACVGGVEQAVSLEGAPQDPDLDLSELYQSRPGLTGLMRRQWALISPSGDPAFQGILTGPVIRFVRMPLTLRIRPMTTWDCSGVSVQVPISAVSIWSMLTSWGAIPIWWVA